MMVARAVVVPLLIALVAPLSATSPAAAAPTTQAGVAGSAAVGSAAGGSDAGSAAFAARAGVASAGGSVAGQSVVAGGSVAGSAASADRGGAAAAAAVSDSEAGFAPPLSTRGRYIVDANGERFKLRSGNWHGASGTWIGDGDTSVDANHHAGENAHRIPMGLDRAPLGEIVVNFRAIGLNSVRLPFSDEMIGDAQPVTDDAVAANPQLKGKTPLQVYDAVVAALTGAGLAVILNNHTTTTRWCCGVDGNERWNSSQSTQQWEDNWLTMVRRYRDNPRVVGADLYNEVRRDVWDDPNWGSGDEHDWFAASQHLGDRILREANPNLLIVVEGINWTGIPVDGFAHGRPTLTPARWLSHTLVTSGKLVYSAHFYDYTGPNHSGATGVGETSDPRYRDFSRDDLFAVLYQDAFFVSQEQGQHFTAPVWISEFGVDGSAPEGSKQRQWFVNFVDYLIQVDADFAYWPVVGWSETRGANDWALLFYDKTGQMAYGDAWRAEIWNRLVAYQGRTGVVDAVPTWDMLSPDRGDFIQSSALRDRPDWDPGARKAACPDGQRLAGLAHTGNRGLCTDATTAVTGNSATAPVAGSDSAAPVAGSDSAATVAGSDSAATVAGSDSAATVAGSDSAAPVAGNDSAATVAGNDSAATVAGNDSAATVAGNDSAATVAGNDSAATVAGSGAATVTGYEVVEDERYVTSDWASGYSKLQCPAGAFVVGYAVRGAAMSSVICALTAVTTAKDGRTLWFDRGDNRPAGNPGGDFATGNYKGQCAAGEAVVGVAYTGRIGKSRMPDALYCE